MPAPVPGQTELMPTPVAALDASRGILEFSIDDLQDIDPDRRVTLARLALSFGSLLGPAPAAHSKLDRTLKIDGSDFERSEPRSIQCGLYIPSDDPRYRNADQLIKIRYSSGIQVAVDGGLKLPFESDSKHPGVVFGADEFHLVARSPDDLVRATKARTQRANEGRQPREVVRQTVNRSAAHMTESYLKRLAGLEAGYIDDHRLLTSLHRQTRGADSNRRPPRNQYKAGNLDRVRRRADEMFHQTVETAAINNGWSQVAINGVHRAIVSNLYRRGSSRDVDLAWRTYINMQGLYINARRFKLIQSRMACESQYSLYQPYLEAAEA